MPVKNAANASMHLLRLVPAPRSFRQGLIGNAAEQCRDDSIAGDGCCYGASQQVVGPKRQGANEREDAVDVDDACATRLGQLDRHQVEPADALQDSQSAHRLRPRCYAWHMTKNRAKENRLFAI